MREHILVIDDDEKITALLKRSLTFEGYTVSVADNGRDGLKQVLHEEPDLLILDIMMPQIDGWEVCRRLREAESDVPILMLTAKDEIGDRVKGLDLGADDYLVKPFALDELTARIRSLLRRRSERSIEGRNKLTYLDLTMDVDTHEVIRADQRIELTVKEFELFQLFMRNPKRVLPRDMIMERVWGYDYSGESNVLEVYIALLRQKLEEHGPRVIQTIRGLGYVLRGEQ